MSEGKGAYRIALGEADAAGGVVSLANPEEADVIITKLIIDVTTKSTGACTVDAGIAANGSTSDDTLIDGLDVGAAAILADNITNKGTNGNTVKKWGASEYLTISKATGAAAGLIGYAYVEWVRE